MNSQTVFALRKAGHIHEALTMARNLVAANPRDEWNVKALAWSLHSAVKAEPDAARQADFAKEFMALPELPAEEFLCNVRKGMKRLAEPDGAGLAAAREASKAGNIAQAMTLFREYLRTHSGDAEAETSLAWELCKSIQSETKNEEPNAERMTGFVKEYEQLNHVLKPSTIHSRMLQAVARAARSKGYPKFCEFLKWWSPAQHLREEDMKGNPKPDGGTYDGTVEAAIAAVGKTIAGCSDASARRVAADFVEEQAAKYPTQEWFPYYRVVCRLAMGQTQEAKVLLIPIVRAKMGEFWAWQKLASCFESGSPEQLQCLCRAAICPVKGEEYLVSVYAELGARLLETERAPQGRHLLEKARAIRSGKGWGLSPELQEALVESEDIPAADPTRLLQEWGSLAEDVLLSDLPWRKAAVASINVEMEKDGQKKLFHFVKVELDGDGRDCRVPANKMFRKLEEMEPGAPLSVRVDLSGHHPRIVAFKPRPEGDRWDVCPQATGTVKQINAERGLAVVSAPLGGLAFAYFNTCPEAQSWSVGDVVDYRWQERNEKIRILALSSKRASERAGELEVLDDVVPF